MVKIKGTDDESTILDIINFINLGIFSFDLKIAPLFGFISSTAVKVHDYILEIIGPKFSGIIVPFSFVLSLKKGDLYFGHIDYCWSSNESLCSL